MSDLIFSITDTTVTRARLAPDHVLFQVLEGILQPGEVIAEIRVDYTTLGVILGLATRRQPTTDPVLAALLLAQETAAQMGERG